MPNWITATSEISVLSNSILLFMICFLLTNYLNSTPLSNFEKRGNKVKVLNRCTSQSPLAFAPFSLAPGYSACEYTSHQSYVGGANRPILPATIHTTVPLLVVLLHFDTRGVKCNEALSILVLSFTFLLVFSIL